MNTETSYLFIRGSGNSFLLALVSATRGFTEKTSPSSFVFVQFLHANEETKRKHKVVETLSAVLHFQLCSSSVICEQVNTGHACW